jgi:hypothetical protein
MKSCKICGGKMVQAGEVTFKNPVTKRPKTRIVLRCKKCNYRVV